VLEPPAAPAHPGWHDALAVAQGAR
jgi:hypothetical protein